MEANAVHVRRKAPNTFDPLTRPQHEVTKPTLNRSSAEYSAHRTQTLDEVAITIPSLLLCWNFEEVFSGRLGVECPSILL